MRSAHAVTVAGGERRRPKQRRDGAIETLGRELESRKMAPTAEARTTLKADQEQGARLTCGPEQRQRAQSGPGHHRLPPG